MNKGFCSRSTCCRNTLSERDCETVFSHYWSSPPPLAARLSEQFQSDVDRSSVCRRMEGVAEKCRPTAGGANLIISLILDEERPLSYSVTCSCSVSNTNRELQWTLNLSCNLSLIIPLHTRNCINTSWFMFVYLIFSENIIKSTVKNVWQWKQKKKKLPQLTV
jgi:hypothetical protein